MFVMDLMLYMDSIYRMKILILILAKQNVRKSATKILSVMHSHIISEIEGVI